VGLINDIYKTVFKPVFDLIKKVVMDTLGIVNSLWQQHGEKTLGNVRGVLKSLRELFQQLWDDILKPIIMPFLEMLSESWDKHLKGVVNSIGVFVLKLINAATEIF